MTQPLTIDKNSSVITALNNNGNKPGNDSKTLLVVLPPENLRNSRTQSNSQSVEQSVKQSSKQQNGSAATSHSSSSSSSQSTQQLIKVDRRSPETRQCSKCIVESVKSDASSFCTICQHWLCQEHLAIHNKRTDYASHRTRSVNEAVNQPKKKMVQEILTFPHIPCGTHPTSALDIFCETCNQFICVRCAYVDHSVGHIFHPKKDLIDQWKIQVTECQKIEKLAQPALTQINLMKPRVNQSILSVDQDQSKALKILNQSIARISSLKDSSQKHEAKLCKRIKSALSGVRNSLDTQLVQFADQHNHLKTDTILVKKRIEKLDFIKIRLASETLAQQLEECGKLIDKFNQSHQSIKSNNSSELKQLVLSNGPDVAKDFDGDMDMLVRTSCQTLQQIIDNWTDVQLCSLKDLLKVENESNAPDSTGQTDQQVIQPTHEQSTNLSIKAAIAKYSTVKESSKSKAVVNSDQSSEPALPHLSDQSTGVKSVNQSTNQSINQVDQSLSEDFVDEEQTSTFYDLVQRIRNVPVIQPANQSMFLSAIYDDLANLSSDEYLYLTSMSEDVYATIVLFICEQLPVLLRSADQPINLEYFYMLYEAMIQLLMYQRVSLDHKRVNPAHDLAGRLPIVCSFSPYRLRAAYARLGSAMGTISWILVNSGPFPIPMVASPMSRDILAMSQYASDIKCLCFDHFDDVLCLKLVSILRQFTDLRRVSIKFDQTPGRAVSQSTYRKLFSSFVADCPKLVSLQMDRCSEISSLLLSKLTQLSVLQLGDINNVGMLHLAASVKAMPSLRQLILSRCEFSKACCQSFSSNIPTLLESLELINCKIDCGLEAGKMFDMIGCCKQLQRLRFSDCDLPESMGNFIMGGIKRLSNFRELHLDNNASLNPKINLLSKNGPQLLTHLDLRCVGNLDGGSLIQLLSKSPSLSALLIGQNTVTAFGELVAKLPSLSKLNILDMSCTKMDEATGVAFSGLLPQLRTLTTLRIAGNSLPTNATKILCQNLKHLIHLERLDLSDNHLGSVTGQLYESMKCLCRLQELSLNGTGFGPGSCSSLAEGFKFTTKLVYLNVSHNPLGSQGITQMATSLSKLASLRSLIIYGAFLTPPSGRVIGTLLKELHSLTNLQLGFNELGDTGVVAIVENLSYGNRIRDLGLDDCSFGDAGMRAIIAKKSDFKYLNELNVRHNPLIGKRECARAIKEFGNKISTEFDEEIN